MMFIACPVRGDELIPERRIRSLTNTPTGIVLRVDCYCGQQHLVRTGRLAPATTG
ncbi:hypothetical protein BH18ACT7_BH18ACT7_18760 [soil metagenome]